jgi:hypothetical protein
VRRRHTIRYDPIAYSLPRAAAIADVDPGMLRAAIYYGDLTAHHAGQKHSKPLITPAELADWMTARSTRVGDGW